MPGQRNTMKEKLRSTHVLFICIHASPFLPMLLPCRSCSAASAAACLRSCRSAPSALHRRRCPARQSACEQAVPQYHTARQALQREGGWQGAGSAGKAARRRMVGEQAGHIPRLTCTFCCLHPGVQPGRRRRPHWRSGGRRSCASQPPWPPPPSFPPLQPAVCATAASSQPGP